jgi:adenine-specific DNA methylase
MNNKDDLKPMAIEGSVPVKAVGIENLKESNPQHMPPHRYLHPWFARRPTPVARLAVLSSILPKGVSSDQLLNYIQIGPSNTDNLVEDYVLNKKRTESERDGTLGEHYGYPRPFTRSPSSEQIEEIHQLLKEHWGGELPNVLDPTAGGGVIPYESIRYNIPTAANELNTVPTVILKILLEHAPKVGSLKQEVNYWGDQIVKDARDELRPYFPPSKSGRVPLAYSCTYRIDCDSCGGAIPLTPKWWIAKRADMAIYPEYTDDRDIKSYRAVNMSEDDVPSGFDPSQGPVSRSGAECPHCEVVIESDRTRELIKEEKFEYELLGVKYSQRSGGNAYRGANKQDQQALRSAQERIDADPEIFEFLSVEIPDGQKTSEPISYGMTQWRDLFTPRQLLSQYEYLQAYNHHSQKIREKYEENKADAILTLLALAGSKVPDHNSRLTSWYTPAGHPGQLFRSNHFSPQKLFSENNISEKIVGFTNVLDRIVEEYENIVNQMDHVYETSRLDHGDAADLDLEDDSISAVVVDPPYYDNIMYAELADFFYVIQKEYIGDLYPEFFQQKLTDKENEAVANPSKFDGIAGDRESKTKLAKKDYEEKMGDIFREMSRVVEPGGVMTVMFTHKDSDAWDTLTMSLINSGFVITSTHPVTSEVPHRVGMQNSASADSTILLTGRKPNSVSDTENELPSLWSDVKSKTRKAAKESARELIESGLHLTKTDIIISAFGPTLRVFADAYPVVDNEDNSVPPRRALEEAREAVTQVLVDEYIEGNGISNLDDVTKWYVLCWLVHESQTFAYDDGRQLGLGIGVDIDDIKRNTKTWRKSRGDIYLRGHSDRVQDVEKKPENRSSRTPVNPDDLSFNLELNKIHAAMHIYDARGESSCCDWLRERSFDSDTSFKVTLKTLLQVLPSEHKDWELARDLAVGRTRDVLGLEFSPNYFSDEGDKSMQSELTDH